jgi:hypothetical protein
MGDAPLLVHPLTLRFSNAALEPAYLGRAFAESFPIFVGFCVEFVILLGLWATVLPGVREFAVFAASVFTTLLGARAWLHHYKCQERAASHFAWGWSALVSLGWAGILLRGRDDKEVHVPMSAHEFYTGAALSTLIEGSGRGELMM